MANAAKEDPRQARDGCFKCGSKLVPRAEEHHATSGKGVRSGWSYRAAEGRGITHTILACPTCREVRAVDGRSGT